MCAPSGPDVTLGTIAANYKFFANFGFSGGAKFTGAFSNRQYFEIFQVAIARTQLRRELINSSCIE